MRTWKWMITASLLIAFSAMAQQTTAPAAPSQTEMPPAPPAANPAALQNAPQPAASTPAPSPAPPAAAAPTTMDQVVDRAIEREHALITFLQARTPLVETYLQNL